MLCKVCGCRVPKWADLCSVHKYVKPQRKAKSKADRQQWFKGLTPEQRYQYIEKRVAEKAEQRQQKSLKLMVKYGDKFKCSECFHGQVKSCPAGMPNGCEYWFNPKSNLKGIARDYPIHYNKTG